MDLFKTLGEILRPETTNINVDNELLLDRVRNIKCYSDAYIEATIYTTGIYSMTEINKAITIVRNE